jgi:hypothetical protein
MTGSPDTMTGHGLSPPQADGRTRTASAKATGTARTRCETRSIDRVLRCLVRDPGRSLFVWPGD